MALPRALFVAAFAAAGAMLIPLRARPPAPRHAGPAAIERRDKSLRAIARNFGSAIVAAGREARDFAVRGRLSAPAVPLLDKRVRVIIESAEVAQLIGRPEPMPEAGPPDARLDDGAPWVGFSPEPPRVTLMWRGGRIASDQLRSGRPVAHHRAIDAEAFAHAIKAAVRALEAAGIATNGFIDVRADRRSEQRESERAGFGGLTATIGLRRERPAWLRFPTTRPARTSL